MLKVRVEAQIKVQIKIRGLTLTLTLTLVKVQVKIRGEARVQVGARFALIMRIAGTLLWPQRTVMGMARVGSRALVTVLIFGAIIGGEGKGKDGKGCDQGRGRGAPRMTKAYPEKSRSQAAQSGCRF